MLAPWRASADFFKQSRSLNESSSPPRTREKLPHVNRTATAGRAGPRPGRMRPADPARGNGLITFRRVNTHDAGAARLPCATFCENYLTDGLGGNRHTPSRVG